MEDFNAFDVTRLSVIDLLPETVSPLVVHMLQALREDFSYTFDAVTSDEHPTTTILVNLKEIEAIGEDFLNSEYMSICEYARGVLRGLRIAEEMK